jgi:dihydrofolate reductase / thymidylate synthase
MPTKLMKKYPKHAEMQYLEVINDVIETGKYKDDRTSTGIYTKFGNQMRYDLQHSFPVLTTKDVFWRGVAEELLWFVKGETNAKLLSDKKIKIWDGNASREFLDNLGLKDREEWDLGPVYGFQWRHFGAKYENMHKDYTNEGVDQLASVINTIKTNPQSRRIVLTAWNPSAIPEMALPPCHIFAQFYVSGDEKPKLSCQMYQRSCDLGLGVPFNIASYALLTCMLAQVCGLERGEFIHSLGDSHIYSNHVEPLKEQLKRIPHPFPQLSIDPSITEIDKFEYSHFKLVNYTHDKKIKMPMAV